MNTLWAMIAAGAVLAVAYLFGNLYGKLRRALSSTSTSEKIDLVSSRAGSMNQTPVHDIHNADVLLAIPTTSMDVIEIGCSSGALAREFKKRNPKCHYLGIDIDPNYIELAKRYCDLTLAMDIETANNAFYLQNSKKDCWVFADVLEHLRDPWNVLRNIRNVIPETACVVACIPNAQHWSMFAKLSVGDFRYQDMGLFDRTHLRWFTRQTVFELFNDTGFRIAEARGRVFDDPNREKFLPLIGELAKTCGFDPNVAISDAIPLQYVVTAVPI